MHILVLQMHIYIRMKYDGNLQICEHVCFANIISLIFIYWCVFSLLYSEYPKLSKKSDIRVIYIVLCVCGVADYIRVIFAYYVYFLLRLS